MPKQLIVVTHKQHYYDDLANHSHLPIRLDLGFGPPDNCEDAAWWMPGEHAAKLIQAGISLPLISVPSLWLALIPEEYTKRKISWHWSYENPQGAGFYKLAQSKSDKYPAKLYKEYPLCWLEELPDFTPILKQEWLEGINMEYRVLISNYVAVGSSRYNTGNAHYPFTKGRCRGAEEFATAVAQDILGPKTYIMDVASLKRGGFAVVEFNNVWSSNPYGLDMYRFTLALEEAVDYTDSTHWFVPDALQRRQATGWIRYGK